MLYSWDKPQSRDRDRDSKFGHNNSEVDITKPERHSTSTDHANKQHHRHSDAQGTDRHAEPSSNSRQTHEGDEPRGAHKRDVTNARDSTGMQISQEEGQKHSQRHVGVRRPVVNPNSKQAELLASVASEMNTFSNDGSFMEQFAAQQGGGFDREPTGNAQSGAGAPDDAELALSGVYYALCF